MKTRTHAKRNLVSSPPDIRKAFLWLSVFAVAMGFLEGIVVVYLRQVYYPGGFDFPLTLLTPEMLSVEWLREIATLVMLVAVAWLAGRNFLHRLSFFLYAFAVWDIFYYVALKLILDWPSSWLTWDILFLIPVPWIGPVLAPVICSLTMILMAMLFTCPTEKGKSTMVRPLPWLLIFAGSAVIFFTFIRDYLELMIRNLSGAETALEKEELLEIMASYIPAGYSWPLFIAGELSVIAALFLFLKRSGQR